MRYVVSALLGVGLLLGILTALEKPVEVAASSNPLRSLRTAAGPATSNEGLAHAVSAATARLADKPGDEAAAIALADALLRQTRVTGNAGLARQAETALLRVLDEDADAYAARRMLAVVYLSQHRFLEAIATATTCLQFHPDDAAVYGVLADGYIELGDHEQAFDAIDRMLKLRPDATAYARASYARELQGDLAGALRLMKMAAESTSPHDVEGLAWHRAQLGHLHLQLGEFDKAERAFAHADHLFPGHPFALDGRVRIRAALGEYEVALRMLTDVHPMALSPDEAALRGDLLMAMGRADEAEGQYRLAEVGWQTDQPDPVRLARFRMERGR